MDALLPFTLPLVCLLWTIVGLTALLRAKAVAQKKMERAKEASGDVVKVLWRVRLSAAFWLALGLGGLLVTGFSAGIATDQTSVSANSGSDELASLIARNAQQTIQDSGIVGIVVAAVAGDQEVIIGVGQTAIGSSSAPTADTVYEIGSISKVFTGILLAQAIAREELTLAALAQDLMPDGATLPAEIREQVTLRHLTTHSSGFPRLPENFLTASNLIQIVFGGDPHRTYEAQEFREALQTVELDFAPGEKSVYSNFAVSLLGYLLATRADQPYEALMRSQIARPLGMNSTSVVLSDADRAQLAQGYRSGYRMGGVQLALTSATWDMPDHYAAAGGIRSTAKDMMVFLKANMGRIDTPLERAIRASHEPLMQRSQHREIGMNWLREKQPDGAADILWHNGGTGGYRTFLGFTDDGEYGVVVLANTAVSVDGLAFELLDEMQQELQSR